MSVILRGKKSLLQRAINVLRKFGTDAHLYLPGAAIPVLGPNLVVNGDFANGTTGWAGLNTSFVVSGGALQVNTADNTAGCFGYPELPVGKTCKFSYTVSNYVSGTHRLQVVGNAVSMAYATGNGTFSGILYVNAFTAVAVQGNVTTGLNATIDNITVQEVLGYTSHLSGLTAGNYLDSAGTDLLDSVTQVDQPVGLALDALGGLGVELSLPSAWNIFSPGGIAIDADTATATFTGTPANYSGVNLSNTPLKANTTYRAQFTISNYTVGNIVLKGGSAAGVTASAANGTYSYVFTTTVAGVPFLQVGGTSFNGVVSNISVREVTGIHASQGTTADKGILRLTNGKYNWVFDSTDKLVATFPAGWESATTIDAKSTGHVTLQNQNIVGTYLIGPNLTTYGRIILKTAPTASELALLQSFANRLAGR